MLRSVKVVDQYTETVYECMRTTGGFVCRCGKTYFGPFLPVGCGDCGGRFAYEFETGRYEMGLGCVAPGRVFFANAQDPVQRLEPPDAPMARGGSPIMAELVLLYRGLMGRERQADVGPTTACFDCGAIIPIGDCFYSSTVDQRALCEDCYGKAEKAGRARVKSGG